MSLAIRNAIVARLASVPGIGQVHAFERFAANDKGFRALYARDAAVLGWHVRRVGRREFCEFNLVDTDWEIRGFAGLYDAEESELAFDALLDAIFDAWRADPTLGGVVFYPKDDAPMVPTLADSGPVMFAGVLCHAARLTITTRHRQETATPWE